MDLRSVISVMTIEFNGKNEEGEGRFWLDLSEVTKYFNKLSIGARIPRR